MEVTLHHQLGGINNTPICEASASRLVRVAFGVEGWQTLDLKDAEYNRRFRAHPVFHAFLLPPEAIASIPEWDEDLEPTPTTAEPSRVLATVDSSAPFDSTNIPRSERRSQPLTSRHDTAQPPPKRRKVQLSPLYHLIEQPHQYLSPEPLSSPGLNPVSALREYEVERYLQDGARDQLQMRHKRIAWIVPTRGKPPGAPECTPAAFAPTLSALFAEGAISATILWRKETARAFWDFLVRIRKQQVFGQLGFAYETSAEYDFIKVYHSACHSLRLRTALDSFRNEADVPQKGAKPYRPLKSAVLVLVDEVNRGLLIA
ncbi:hypothetical protein AURDEDRAFT_158780 [Auricularia subglabra TFB-10046 SS5]|nr:hypothetical protein AURDEDRAFT_158780 [Auricularia subglabra TFB-10046 SS5]